MTEPAKMVDPWFTLDGEEMARAVRTRCELAMREQYTRRGLSVCLGAAIEGFQIDAFNATGLELSHVSAFKALSVPIVRNELRSCAQTILAKVFAPDAPKPFVMSDGGDFEQRSAAELAQDFLVAEMGLPQGQFDNTDDMFNQAGYLAIACTGTAAVIVRPGYDQVECELDDTLTWGLDQSGPYGAILGVVRKAWYDVDDMLARYTKPKQQAAIRASIVEREDPLALAVIDPKRTTLKRRAVEVCEAWRFSSRGVVGRHVIVPAKSAGDCHWLVDEDYDFTDMPAVMVSWDRSLASPWGEPATQAVIHEFLAQNRMLADVDQTIISMPGAIVAAPEGEQGQLGSSHAVQRINSDNPDRIKVFTLDKLDQASLQMSKEHGDGIHAIMGISPSQTAGQRAVGTSSGVHEELVAKLTSERFADHQRRLVQAKVVRASKLFLRAARQMLESNGSKGFKRQFKNRDGKTYRVIKASDLDLDESRYVFTVAPVSEDDRSPQQLAARADELVRLGVIGGQEWWQAQKNADLPAAVKLFNTQWELVEWQIRNWLTAPVERLNKLYISPRKYNDLAAMGRQVTGALQEAQMQGCPDERIALFERFLDETIALEKEEAMFQAGLQSGAPESGEMMAPAPEEALAGAPMG
jgi:hypothetical protein